MNTFGNTLYILRKFEHGYYDGENGDRAVSWNDDQLYGGNKARPRRDVSW